MDTNDILKARLKKIDENTLNIINDRYGVLELLYDFAGYAQMCNREIVDMKKAIKSYTGMDINPLNEEQKAMLRRGGDTLNEVREVIVRGNKMKDNEVKNANYVKTKESGRKKERKT